MLPLWPDKRNPGKSSFFGGAKSEAADAASGLADLEFLALDRF